MGGGVESLVNTLKAWLGEQRPCEVFNGLIDPAKLVRELSKEVRLAERIQTRIDPPKPEREPSQRKRRQKELNEDFIDISSQRAFSAIVLQSKKKTVKKPQISPKKDTSSSGTAKTTTSAASKDDQKSPTKK